jgi:hypothetical protein
MTISKNNRSYTVGKYGIELQHTFAGWVNSIDGGHASREVVVEKIGTDALHHKHLGPLKYEEITFKCGTGMSAGLYDWIRTGFNQTSNTRGREDGSVIFTDYDNNEVTRLDWTQGLTTELGMPALDASSKEACMMTIKFQPETTRKRYNIGGKLTPAQLPANANMQKQWLPSNFKLTLDKHPNGCDRVNKIEALVIKQKVTDDPRGDVIDYEKVPGSVEIPNLVFTMPEAFAEQYYRLHELFVIGGGDPTTYETNGHLVYLANDVKTELFSLDFVNLGLFKITPDKVDAGGEPVKRVKVEFYCEDIKLNYNPAYTFGRR